MLKKSMIIAFASDGPKSEFHLRFKFKVAD